jgi:hypothetical protein
MHRRGEHNTHSFNRRRRDCTVTLTIDQTELDCIKVSISLTDSCFVDLNSCVPIQKQLSNAIEPFLQTTSAEDESAAYVPGRFHPSPSIGLLRCQSMERARGRRSPSSERNKVGIRVFLSELQQADIHAALNRALVHIARYGTTVILCIRELHSIG